jgi:polar amino acid transport system substrate-binding protein
MLPWFQSLLRFFILPLLIAGLLGLAAFSRSSAAASETLTIAADAWCPVNCAAIDPHVGIGIDLARRVFEPLGYEVRYVIMSWSRALEEVRAGRVDAVVGANHSDDPTLLLPQTPILHITDDFYVRRDSALIFSGFESLKGQRLGVIHDYGYALQLKVFLAAHRRTPAMVQEVSGNDALRQNIRKLLAGRIDVLVESGPVMDYTLRRQGLTEKIKHIGGVLQGDVYLAFSPAHPDSKRRAAAYDRGIAELRKTGALSALYGVYGLQP